MSKVFYIIEARDTDTNHVEKRRVYCSQKQYASIGLKQVRKLSELYNLKVTKHICTESIEILNTKKTLKTEWQQDDNVVLSDMVKLYGYIAWHCGFDWTPPGTEIGTYLHTLDEFKQKMESDKELYDKLLKEFKVKPKEDE